MYIILKYTCDLFLIIYYNYRIMCLNGPGTIDSITSIAKQMQTRTMLTEDFFSHTLVGYYAENTRT
jgi:hypothetical protein